jgi:hypothetical protein
MDRIVNMIIRRVVNRVVGKGVDKGAEYLSARRSPDGQPPTSRPSSARRCRPPAATPVRRCASRAVSGGSEHNVGPSGHAHYQQEYAAGWR